MSTIGLFSLSEPVTITPTNGRNGDGDPVAPGTPFTLSALVAPGNSTLQFSAGGDLESADFTVFLPLGTVLPDEFRIRVRGSDCVGRVQLWDAGGAVGGLAVLAKSATGRS